MRITAGQLVAGYPAVKVRNFLRRYRDTGDCDKAVETELAINPEAAGIFLRELVTSGLFEISQSRSGGQQFTLTRQGEIVANTSAAKPIHRKTAERVLAEFMERVNAVNATSEYLYRVNEVILFGSMLSDIEQLGDVDVAVNMEPKVSDADALKEWSMARRHVAQAEGRSFSTDLEWICWPIVEVYKQLKARSRSLSLHELAHVKRLSNLPYRVLLGDPDRLAVLLPAGRAIPNSMVGLIRHEAKGKMVARSFQAVCDDWS
jgi:predicted nucleotidyltransferase